MILLIDIGNTHTHLGLARGSRVLRRQELPTRLWGSPEAATRFRAWLGPRKVTGAALGSVVPEATGRLQAIIRRQLGFSGRELSAASLAGMGIDYPRPETIGADRLANALAARHLAGYPVMVIDFGTAATFDVVDDRGAFIGGIIAPGIAAMTEYLHEKTALLPLIKIRSVHRAVGRSTREAMQIGAVLGYRSLVRGLIGEVRRELGHRRLPVIATGGYAGLVAQEVPEISAVIPHLTLHGLRLFYSGTATH